MSGALMFALTLATLGVGLLTLTVSSVLSLRSPHSASSFRAGGERRGGARRGAPVHFASAVQSLPTRHAEIGEKRRNARCALVTAQRETADKSTPSPRIQAENRAA